MAWSYLRGRPQDLPWAPLDLGQPIGLFTGRKLAALDGEPARCAALLDLAGVRYATVSTRRPAESQCGYDSAVRLERGGARRIALTPESVAVACPVAAALAMWEWDVVAPAAQRHFGARVSRIEHLGSYSCRRMYGRSSGGWSEHATANALDVAGFRLDDGTRVSVLRDWRGGDAKAAFLRDVRDGACRVFATVLSPDYNAAHRDHLHLDQAARGATGWRACR
ncbi:extensin family protein [Sphingomonas phyllosphaerae]|uniref:extensin-like domain-containing protein n=1 Tax=Sphingomonas phyllosphaerae TaxID=257003 RepID=UPI00241321C7|nr:extensin family protein [Sphingomonas phyllosphaerae]